MFITHLLINRIVETKEEDIKQVYEIVKGR